MKDIAGQTLNVGDEVAFIIVGNPTLKVGKIIGFTPKMAKIEYQFGEDSDELDIVNRPYNQVVKLGQLIPW